METINDIVHEMRLGMIPKHRHDRELLLNYADRLEAAHKRDIEDATASTVKEAAQSASEVYEPHIQSKTVGNAAKTREALLKLLSIADHLLTRYALPKLAAIEILELKQIAGVALSAPARNCDVMSLESARKLWFAKEIIPRLNGDLPLGKEVPFEEWFVSQQEKEEAKGEAK